MDVNHEVIVKHNRGDGDRTGDRSGGCDPNNLSLL